MDRMDRLQAMLKDYPNDSFVLFAIAMEYKNQESYEMAIEQFNSLKNRDPEYVGLYYHLAECLYEIENFKDALFIYDQGISIANKLMDQHAKAELMNAKTNLEMEM